MLTTVANTETNPVKVEIVRYHNKNENGFPRSRFTELESNRWVNNDWIENMGINQRINKGKFYIFFNTRFKTFYLQREFETEAEAREFFIKTFMYEI